MGADAPNMGLWVRPENIAIHKYLIQIAWYEIISSFLFWIKMNDHENFYALILSKKLIKQFAAMSK